MGLRPFAVFVLGLGALLGAAHSTRSIAADLARPLSVSGNRYVGSHNCRHCHADNYDSWHRTFHRTMTQEASEASVLGDFTGARFSYLGVEARMTRESDGSFRMSFSRDGGRERWSATIARTVGSRRYQQYLARDGDIYFRLPVAWSIEEGRWMHMNGAFLTPDPDVVAPDGAVSSEDYNRHVTRWNDNCIFCHNVAPRPGLDEASGAFDSSVAELGIACEACHGPASEHVALNHNPLRRFALHLGHQQDPSIANPQHLDDARSAQVCGRCHGQRISRDIAEVHREGDRFVPGEDLSRYSRPLQRDSLLNDEEGVFTARFWPDGTARLTAYEYQGLLASPCAERGAMTCGSCHAMHAGDPRGQLHPDREGDAACVACHGELSGTTARAAHSHHDADGPGSSCLACHMPRSVYGLIDAHRSHRITSPDPGQAASASSPDACTLCHTDRSRSWAAEHRQRWWPHGTAHDEPDDRPESTRLLLAGDPIERAIAAAALGRTEATAAGADVDARLGLLLHVMAEDDYPAVRSIAWRSLHALLRLHHPSSAPALTAFTATDDSTTRRAQLSRMQLQLPPGAVTPPSGDDLALRELQPRMRIFIGE
jgi:hypothetical protein